MDSYLVQIHRLVDGIVAHILGRLSVGAERRRVDRTDQRCQRRRNRPIRIARNLLVPGLERLARGCGEEILVPTVAVGATFHATNRTLAEEVALLIRPCTIGIVASKVVEECIVALHALAARLPKARQTDFGELWAIRTTKRDRTEDVADDFVDRLDDEPVDRFLDRLQRQLQNLVREEAEDVATGAAFLRRRQKVDPGRLECEDDVADAASEAASKALVDEAHGVAHVDRERLDAVHDGRAHVRRAD